jgi:hypothetical protein
MMVDKEISQEEKDFINKQVIINYKDVMPYNPNNVPIPIGMKEWKINELPSKEYAEMMSELIILIRYIAMKISQGCSEVQESMPKRCASLSLILNELVQSVAIDGWHMYGLTLELQQNTYMSLGGKTQVIDILNAINIANKKLAENKMKGAIV